MDAFGGSPGSRLNKSIADMEEKFEKELDSHVNLIEINAAKITALYDEFKNKLDSHDNLIAENVKKISALDNQARVVEMKIMRLESTLVPEVEKYFSENNNKHESLIESVQVINKNIKDLKTNLTYTHARIVILEDRAAEK